MIETLSAVLLIITLIVSLFVVSGVFINKFKGADSETTYPKWRTRLLYAAILCGYSSGVLNEIVLFQNDESSLSNLIIVSLFYTVSTVLVTFLAMKKPIQEDENGQKVDYRNVQFFLVLILGFMPIILLS